MHLADEFCSNFHGEINQQVAAAMKTEPLCADYPAWDWHGTVWFDQESQTYCCQVKRYGSHVDTVEAATPEQLREELCNKYGWK